jgi:hypothetical protein
VIREVEGAVVNYHCKHAAANQAEGLRKPQSRLLTIGGQKNHEDSNANDRLELGQRSFYMQRLPVEDGYRNRIRLRRWDAVSGRRRHTDRAFSNHTAIADFSRGGGSAACVQTVCKGKEQNGTLNRLARLINDVDKDNALWVVKPHDAGEAVRVTSVRKRNRGRTAGSFLERAVIRSVGH